MPPRRNQEKAEFVAYHLRLAPRPGNRGRARAQKCYDSLYYKTDENVRAADAAQERAHQARLLGAAGAALPGPAGLPAAAHPAAGPPDAAPHPPAHPAAGAQAPNPAPDDDGERNDGDIEDQTPEVNEGADIEDDIDNDNSGGTNDGDAAGAGNDPDSALGGPASSDSDEPAAGSGGNKHPTTTTVVGNDTESDSDDDDDASGSESSSSRATVGSPLLDRLNIGVEEFESRQREYHKLYPPFKSGNWLPGWTYDDIGGGGGFGLVYIYRHLDEEKVMDRVVVKDCIVQPDYRTSFPTWAGNVRNLEDRRHMEIHCLNEIKSVGGTKNCIEIRGEEINNERMSYRTYTCYCVHGDLDGLIAEEGTHEEEDIPEPAVWSIFNDLINACLVMQYGAVEEADVKPDWKPIIHRDLKPGNVFLDQREEDDEEFPNPFAYAFGGTDGYRPLELLRLVSIRTTYPYKGKKLSEKTNVWGVGAILMRLMSRDWNPKGPIYHIEDSGGIFKPEEPEWKNNGDNANVYSRDLQRLVRSCVAFEPRKRPTLRQLQREILSFTTGGIMERAHGMRQNDRPMQEKNMLKYTPENERYKLHLSTAKRQKLR